MEEKLYTCPICSKDSKEDECDVSGICHTCYDEGYWMDPMGTVHLDSEDYDPASAYE